MRAFSPEKLLSCYTFCSEKNISTILKVNIARLPISGSCTHFRFEMGTRNPEIGNSGMFTLRIVGISSLSSTFKIIATSPEEMLSQEELCITLRHFTTSCVYIYAIYSKHALEKRLSKTSRMLHTTHHSSTPLFINF